ncbi:MAG: NAD(P)H-dependent oxidoreductase subunit E [Candidatus Aminicenantes bacterium]|nr:NAD(P)H-dependent oxidoreductase subunit E [Candidatus Aminicenantes bacterium]MDH5715380.1 NAD(P)H-dependent oxidoreductase subunit E [Candidatus Aminicenantes bacterium]
MELSGIQKIVEKNGTHRSALIPILLDIQDEYNFLPRDALTHVAQSLDISLVDVYRAATFYKYFSLVPRGEHLIQVCLGTACHVRGAARVLSETQRKLNIHPGETTEDKLFTLETVNCLGACALGPIVVTDGEYHGQMTVSKVDKLIRSFEKQERVKKDEQSQKH